MPLTKSVFKPLAKSVLIPLGLTAAAATTDADIYKKMFRSGNTTLIISIEEMDEFVKIVKSLEASGLFIKDVAKQLKMKQNIKSKDFLECY